MSMIAVHGPYTFGSKGITEQDELVGTVNPTNGLIWDFRLDYPTTRSAQDFSWAFPTDGAPTPQTVIDPAPVTYATPGSKTVTLTVTNTARTVSNKALTSNVATITTTAPHGFVVGQSVTVGGVDATFNGTYVLTAAAGSTFSYAKEAANVTSGASGGTATSAATGYPVAGTHTITVTAVTGSGAPGTSLRTARGGEEVDVGYDPAAHTVDEVKEFVTEHPDEVRAMYDAEVAGKNRATLTSWLEENTPFDPGDYTIDEVKEYVTENPDTVNDVYEAESAGKNRVTLVGWLEDFQS